MLAFLYDKSFEGLLSAVFDAYTHKRFPDMLHGEDDVLPLTALEVCRVETRPDKVARVFAGLERRLSREGMNNLACAWLGDQPGHDMLLMRYMRGVFDHGGTFEADYAHPDVFAVNRLARNVYGESHQLKGFARFQKTADDIYFCALAPRYNVLPLLGAHFADRLAEQTWVVYDTRRRYGLAHEDGALRDVFFDPALLDAHGRLDPEHLAENEELFQELWQRYCKAATVRERINPRLQSRCMPRRFWPVMTEHYPKTGRQGL